MPTSRRHVEEYEPVDLFDKQIARKLMYSSRVSAVINGPLTKSERRTYIIGGNGRGGTTMIAGVAYLLGLQLNPANTYMEDFHFLHVAQGCAPGPKFKGPKIYESRAQIISALRNSIAIRNNAYDVWGWKDPNVDLYLSEIVTYLINPHLIVVYRDPAAQATAEFALNPNNPASVYLKMALNRYGRYQTLIENLQIPTLMVSYERGRLRPRELAVEMAEFLQFSPTESQLAQVSAYVSPEGGYLV